MSSGCILARTRRRNTTGNNTQHATSNNRRSSLSLGESTLSDETPRLGGTYARALDLFAPNSFASPSFSSLLPPSLLTFILSELVHLPYFSSLLYTHSSYLYREPRCSRCGHRHPPRRDLSPEKNLPSREKTVRPARRVCRRDPSYRTTRRIHGAQIYLKMQNL